MICKPTYPNCMSRHSITNIFFRIITTALSGRQCTCKRDVSLELSGKHGSSVNGYKRSKAVINNYNRYTCSDSDIVSVRHQTFHLGYCPERTNGHTQVVQPPNRLISNRQISKSLRTLPPLIFQKKPLGTK